MDDGVLGRADGNIPGLVRSQADIPDTPDQERFESRDVIFG